VHLGTVEEPIPANVAAGQSYDAIALYSVLEHVPNPVSFLERLTPLLSPEGTLIIRVPRMSAEGPWVSLLDHYWHFTPESLQRALEMQGFTLYDSYPSGAFVDTKGMVLESMTVLAKRSI
jgi:2-polyprenyl-3-methyl-5-hydroxy-6-metoxy-1,4-benzoquinol methylase